MIFLRLVFLRLVFLRLVFLRLVFLRLVFLRLGSLIFLKRTTLRTGDGAASGQAATPTAMLPVT